MSNIFCYISYLFLHINFFRVSLISILLIRIFYILYIDKNAKKVFMPGPMVAFRSSGKLSSYLVIAKL